MLKMIERYAERMRMSEPEGSMATSTTSHMQISSVQSKETPKENISIPNTYKKDKLVAMPINPQWMYFYWDLSEPNASLLKSSEINRVVLRVYDVTYIEFDGTNAHRTFEINVDPLNVRNYYLNVPMPGAHYLGEIGYYDFQGRYTILLNPTCV